MAQSFEAILDVAGKGYTYYPVKAIDGAEGLPFSLTVLLENVLRHGATADEARTLASRIVEAVRGARATRWSSARLACCSRTSLACRCSSTSP